MEEMVECGLPKDFVDKQCKSHRSYIVIVLSFLSLFIIFQTDLSQFQYTDFIEDDIHAVEKAPPVLGERLVNGKSATVVLDTNRTLNTTLVSLNTSIVVDSNSVRNASEATTDGEGGTNRTLNTTAVSLNISSVTDSYSATNVSETTKGRNKIQGKRTATNINADNRTSKPPTFYLHIGPHKTGTTSLQAFIHEYSYILLQDNLHVISKDEVWDGVPGVKDPEHLFAHCMIEGYSKEGGDLSKKFCGTRFMKNFTSTVMKAYNEGQDILLIAEDLDRPEISFRRLKASVKPYTNIKITLSYRWMHDWFPSWYNEINSLYYTVYVEKPEYHMYTFLEWFAEKSEKFFPRHAQGLTERYQTFFKEVTVMNFHQGDDMISHYFCDILQRDKTCAFLQAQDEKQEIQRTSKPMDLARLILYAFRQNLIRTSSRASLRRRQIMDIAQVVAEQLSQTNRTVLDFPHSCMSQSILDSLLNSTIAYESEYFPDWYKSPSKNVNGTWTRQQFEAARTTKWCNLDTDQIIRNRTILLDLIPKTALIRENLPPE